MGRYITGAAGSGGGSGMRNERHVITVNTPALAIPAWAKVVRITGTGGGAGGGNTNTVDIRGAGGGAGGVARDALLMVGAELSLAVTVGAAGAGAAAGSNAAGSNGGDTVVALGSKVITLRGGKAGAIPTQEGAGGKALAGVVYFETNSLDLGDRTWLEGLSQGLPGQRGDLYGSGAPSLFGAGGPALHENTGSFPPVPANTPGGNAVGYGAGGAGGHGTGKGGDGAPGIAIIEFLEAA